MKKLSKYIPPPWTMTVAFFLAATVTVIVSDVHFTDQCSAWQIVPIIQGIFITLWLVVILGSLLSTFLWKLCSGKSVKNKTKFVVWMLFLLVFFIIQNVISATSISFITTRINNKFDAVHDQLVSYYQDQNQFPQSLKDAKIDDSVLFNFPGFKLNYSQIDTPSWSNEEVVQLRVFGKVRHVPSSTFAKNYYIEPGCGW